MRFIKFKLTISIILSFFLSQKFISAQNNNLNKNISIIIKNKPLAYVLNEISQKANVIFSYSHQQIDDQQKVTLIVRRKPIKNVFHLLFSDLNIKYFSVEKQVILKKKFPEEEKQIIPPKETKYTVSGYVKDKATGEVLIGALVYIENIGKGTYTNPYGFYSITLPKGNYRIRFSYLGYEKIIIPASLKNNLKISQNLCLNELELKFIVITKESKDDILEKHPLKSIKLSSQLIEQSTGLVGENDVVKTLQTIPGINSYGDGSVFLYVRGGNKDQNLLYIDEAPIYIPSHLYGFFSAIAPEVINDIKVFKSDFPIQYGGRLSSIIDIKTKDGNFNKFGISGNINPSTNSYKVDGPIVKQKGSYLIAYRHSHINWLLKNQPDYEDVKFYDLHAKLNFYINPKNRIYFSFYTGFDNIKMQANLFNSVAMTWRNYASTLRWNHLFSDKLFSNTTIYASKYDYYLYSSVEDNQYWNSYIGNLNIKNDFTYFIRPNYTLKFGLNYNNHNFNPGNFNDEQYIEKVSAGKATELVFYLSSNLRIKDKLSIFAGIRILNWNNRGPATIYKFNENFDVTDTISHSSGVFNSFLNTEPRVCISYAANKNLSFKLSYNRNIQYLQLLSNSSSPFTTMDVWMPSGPNIKPQKSDQFVFGVHKKFNEFRITGEAFYKKFYNQIDYADNANMLLNPLIEGELRFGSANSYGFEFSLNKQKGNFNAFLAYTYSQTVRKTKDLNYNRAYPANYCKPHNINVNLSYKINRRWFFTANWVYASGMRFSSPTGFYYWQGNSIPIYSEKNNSKLPDYHRLDLSVNLRLNKNKESRYKHSITISAFNVYNQKNPIAINFNRVESSDNEYLIPSDYVNENELVPTSLTLLGIIPSISYKFEFR